MCKKKATKKSQWRCAAAMSYQHVIIVFVIFIVHMEEDSYLCLLVAQYIFWPCGGLTLKGYFIFLSETCFIFTSTPDLLSEVIILSWVPYLALLVMMARMAILLCACFFYLYCVPEPIVRTRDETIYSLSQHKQLPSYTCSPTHTKYSIIHLLQ